MKRNSRASWGTTFILGTIATAAAAVVATQQNSSKFQTRVNFNLITLLIRPVLKLQLLMRYLSDVHSSICTFRTTSPAKTTSHLQSVHRIVVLKLYYIM